MAANSFISSQWPSMLVGLLGLAGFLVLRAEIRSQSQRIDDMIQLQAASRPSDTPQTPPSDASLPQVADEDEADDWSDCRGVATKTSIQTLLERRGRTLHACYEARARERPDLQGGVLLRMKVDPTGNVAGVKTGGTLRDAEVTSCMSSAVRSFRFPPPEGDSCTVISLPFAFGPREEAAP